MPCYDPRENQNDQLFEKQLDNVIIDLLQNKCDELTRMLCLITKDIDIETIKDEHLKTWILAHRLWDKKRTEKENKND